MYTVLFLVIFITYFIITTGSGPFTQGGAGVHIARHLCEKNGGKPITPDTRERRRDLYKKSLRSGIPLFHWTSGKFFHDQWRWPSGGRITGPWCRKIDPLIKNVPHDYTVVISQNDDKACFLVAHNFLSKARIMCEENA